MAQLKAPRWNVDGDTLAILEQVYAVEPFPGIATREALANKLEVSGRQIQVWFQNRRQRERKKIKGSEGGSSLDDAHGLDALSPGDLAGETGGMPPPSLSGGHHPSRWADEPGGLRWPDAPGMRSLDDGALPHWQTSLFPGASPRVTHDPLTGLRMPLGPGASSFDVPSAGGHLHVEQFAELEDALGLGGDDDPVPEKLAPLKLVRSGCSDLLGQMRPFDVPAVPPTPMTRDVLSLSPPAAPAVPPAAAPDQKAECSSDEAQQSAADECVQVVAAAEAPHRIVWPSKAWLSLCGRSAEEVLGKPLAEALCPAPIAAHAERAERAESLSRLFASVNVASVATTRLVSYARDGTSFSHTVRVDALHDSNGEVHLFQVTSSDVCKPAREEGALAADGLGACSDALPLSSPSLTNMKRVLSEGKMLGQDVDGLDEEDRRHERVGEQQLGTDELLELFFT
tara:strand:- start:429 stop:1793 length:1365 start_codon:yes stop_codon:yes gene_type:complete